MNVRNFSPYPLGVVGAGRDVNEANTLEAKAKLGLTALCVGYTIRQQTQFRELRSSDSCGSLPYLLRN